MRRDKASISFSEVTVSASSEPARRSKSCVSARMAARGLARSWRSCRKRSSGTPVNGLPSGKDPGGGAREGPGPLATGRSPWSRRKCRRSKAPRPLSSRTSGGPATSRLRLARQQAGPEGRLPPRELTEARERLVRPISVHQSGPGLPTFVPSPGLRKYSGNHDLRNAEEARAPPGGPTIFPTPRSPSCYTL